VKKEVPVRKHLLSPSPLLHSMEERETTFAPFAPSRDTVTPPVSG
jgi:hypothetical protein